MVKVYVKSIGFSYVIFTIFFIVWQWTQATNFILIRCDGSNQFGRSKCVSLSMWVTNNFVLTCNANGYIGNSSNYSTLKIYVALCHYLKRWLLVLNSSTRDYVYLEQRTSTMLDLIMGCVFLHMWKLLPFRVWLLEGWNGQT